MQAQLRKLVYLIFTLFMALTTIFFLARLAPGDPVERILGPDASEIEVATYRTQLGLDKPVYEQYFSYLKEFSGGDLGDSLFKKSEVLGLLKQHFPPTLIIAIFSILISSFCGVFFGMLSAIKKSQRFDGVTRIVSLLFLSFPIFSLAPILVLIFSIYLGILPVSEWISIKHMVLPILTLSFPLGAIIIRVTRNRFLEESEEPWVTVLYSKGLGESQVYLRVLKSCLPTILNVVAIQLSVVLAGTMITETIFDIPGMGMLLFEAIQNRDYPVVQGVIVYSTVIYMVVYFLIDNLNTYIDPRLKID